MLTLSLDHQQVPPFWQSPGHAGKEALAERERPKRVCTCTCSSSKLTLADSGLTSVHEICVAVVERLQ